MSTKWPKYTKLTIRTILGRFGSIFNLFVQFWANLDHLGPFLALFPQLYWSSYQCTQIKTWLRPSNVSKYSETLLYLTITDISRWWNGRYAPIPLTRQFEFYYLFHMSRYLSTRASICSKGDKTVTNYLVCICKQPLPNKSSRNNIIH